MTCGAGGGGGGQDASRGRFNGYTIKLYDNVQTKDGNAAPVQIRPAVVGRASSGGGGYSVLLPVAMNRSSTFTASYLITSHTPSIVTAFGVEGVFGLFFGGARDERPVHSFNQSTFHAHVHRWRWQWRWRCRTGMGWPADGPADGQADRPAGGPPACVCAPSLPRRRGGRDRRRWRPDPAAAS